MFRTIFKTGLRQPARCRRLTSCGTPQGPFDVNTRVANLPNGVRVITEEIQSPLACASLFVVTGSRYEPAELNGISHFIEHIAYKGFNCCKKPALEESVLSIGAKLYAKTLRDMQIFSIVLPIQCITFGIEILCKIIYDLELDLCEMDYEKEKMMSLLLENEQDPKSVLFDYMHATAFQGTPLAQSVSGKSDHIAGFDKDAVSCFIRENYTTSRLILAVSGGISHCNIVSTAQSTFGVLPYNDVSYTDAGPRRYTSGQTVYRDDSMPYAHVAIAYEAPGYASNEYLTMQVIKNMLGSWDRSQGRASLQACEAARVLATTDVCENYETFYITYQDVGLWGVYFVAKMKQLDAVVSYLQDAWLDFSVACTQSAVQRARNWTQLEMSDNYSGVRKSCLDLGTQMYYTSSRKPVNVLLDEVGCICAEGVKEVAQKYLYNKGPVVVAMGPTEALPHFNRIEAGSYWLRF